MSGLISAVKSSLIKTIDLMRHFNYRLSYKEVMMRLVKTWDEIAENVKTIMNGLRSTDSDEKEYYENLVLRGICFVASQHDADIVFAPSRFIGYAKNTRITHLKNPDKHGDDTNPVIEKILRDSWRQDPDMEQMYQNFCHRFGLHPRARGSFGVMRKYIDARRKRI